ncbi:major facilitator superfamily protein [Myxozyma melibiosi]|uniref:Major facilitator superfamily protein n=1 Tax=Myxozyma melibiosi TaxID=54550 RepID=A0ABR1FE92_9ASCO
MADPLFKFDPNAVPGTVHLVDLHNHDSATSIIPVPRPSSDPEDPLNWSTARKWRTMALVHFYTFIVGWCSAGVYSILADISAATGLSVADLNSGTGTMLLFFGWGCLIWQPFALTFGRRGSYILSLALTCAISVWTAYSTSYATWVVQRILLGLFGSPIECLCEVSITDLFFTHQRGQQLGIYLLMLSGGAYLAPLCNGFINQSMGWKWVMYWCAILSAVACVLCFFFMEETIYYRETSFEATSDDYSSDHSTAVDESLSIELTKEAKSAAAPAPAPTQQSFAPRRSYLQSLALYRVIPEKPNEFFRIIIRPFIVSAKLPLVVWVGVYHGVAVCAFSSMNATASVVLTAAPYNFSSSQVGLTYISPFIGCLIGAIWGGEVNDRICVRLARRNRGYRESEFRLWAAAALCIIPPGGMFVWGVGTNYGVHWFGLVFSMAMLGFAMSTAGTIVLSYMIDSYKELAGETLMAVNIIRCTMAFGYGYAVTPWIENQGYKNAFVEMGVISIVLFSTFALVLAIGKKERRRTAPVYWKLVATGIRALQE